MQKDLHYYLTYAIARRAGIDRKTSRLMAWADQYTDDATECSLHGVQTQAAILDNWNEREIQQTVLVPFHFLPGDSHKQPWVTTANCELAKKLIEHSALTIRDAVAFGIALHAQQDTFSHQGFTGWREPDNSCFGWWYIQSALPNIGHAEMGVVPDIATARWTDPRTNRQISNSVRWINCAKATLAAVCLWTGTSPMEMADLWEDNIRPFVLAALAIKNYDKRKTFIMENGVTDRSEFHRYGYMSKLLISDSEHAAFISAARHQRAVVMEAISSELYCK